MTRSEMLIVTSILTDPILNLPKKQADEPFSILIDYRAEWHERTCVHDA